MRGGVRLRGALCGVCPLLLLGLVLGSGVRLDAQCLGMVGTPIPASPYSVPAGGVTNASLAFGLNGT